MNLTGRNLQLAWLGLNHAISDVRNTIALCPSPNEYERDLEELETLAAEFEELAIKIEGTKDFIDPPEIQSL